MIRALAAAGAVLAVGGTAAVVGGAAIATGEVPVQTSATSISWVSPTEAFVLGTAHCAHKPCTVILSTANRGATWQSLPAPPEAVSRFDGDGLWGIRFADARRGFAYGRGLWATSDGGASWHAIAPPAAFVFDLAFVGTRLVAVASGCGDNEKCAPVEALYERRLSQSRWTEIAHANPAQGESISTHARTAWALLGAKLLVSTDSGRSFISEALPCPHGNDILPEPTSIASDGRHVYLLCIGQGFTGHTLKYLYRTSGTRSGWKLVGKPPAAGDGGELAAGSDDALVLATASAASWLDRSADGGHRWRLALQYGDGGAGWADLTFTTPTDGAVVHGPAQKDGGSANFPGQLLLSDDGGVSWHVVSF